MKNNTHNPTMMIKSKFSNQIHKLVNRCYGVKRNSREFWECKRNEHNNPLTEKQKAELFDELMKIYNECSSELINYFQDRNYKKQVRKERQKKVLVTE